MKKIVETNLYVISVDEAKNRLYQTVRGRWVVPAASYHYEQDVQNALKVLKFGFTILNDARQAETVMSLEWTEIAQNIRKRLADAGMKASAEVLPESAVTIMQVKRISKQAGFQTEYFSDPIEAEAWLDSLI